MLARRDLPVFLFTCAYLLAAVVGAMLNSNGEFLYYIVIMLVLIAAVVAVHRRVNFSTGALWGLSLWGLAHMAGGLVPMEDVGVLYNFWLVPGMLKYDQLIHGLGFALTTWICWQAIRASLTDPQPRAGVLVLCAAAGAGFGALNEVVEFIATLTIPDTNVGGYVNTGWDLVANLIGATTAAILIKCFSRGQISAETDA
jgi:uncharacterized membrane protein YjdF